MHFLHSFTCFGKLYGRKYSFMNQNRRQRNRKACFLLLDVYKRQHLDTLKGVALGSDAFFPFGDNVEPVSYTHLLALILIGAGACTSEVDDVFDQSAANRINQSIAEYQDCLLYTSRCV